MNNMSMCGISLRIALALTVLVCSTNGFCCHDYCAYFACNPMQGYYCNIFCCNCGGRTCAPDHCRQKEEPTLKGDAVRSVFNLIDGNRDKVLNLKEALAYHTNMVNWSNGSALKSTTKNLESEFKKMDANKNGVIEPREFDVSLA